MPKKIIIAACLLTGCLSTLRANTRIDSVSSPDHKLVFYLRTDEKGIAYRLRYRQQEVLNWSALGLIFRDHQLPGETASVKETARKEQSEIIPWINGESKTISNHYKELTVSFNAAGGRHFSIQVRVFNEDIAFRYLIPNEGKTSAILAENTCFQLTKAYTVYRHNTESVISPTPLNDLLQASDLPLVLASPSLFLSINEANNDGYTKVNIAKHGKEENLLALRFIKDTVGVKGAFHSPWRTISVAESAIGLCSHSDLLYKLCEPSKEKIDPSKILPGKLIRDMTLTTGGAKACIDLANRLHFQYIMYDAGWYGKGYAGEGDPTSNPRNVVPEIDMKEVIRYGKSKGIGLILYVNYIGLRKYDMDSSFTLYKGWGVRGLKFGFVNGLTQDGISWLMGAVKKAQDYGFVVDVHDNYKPTGLSRTYPAMLTQEGVRGNENNPDAIHNTTLPFTRFLSGAADYTFCYRNQNDSFNNSLLSKKLQVSKAQQLALTVVFYSPLQSILWYGRPADYKVPVETEFFSYVPTVWDKTVPIEGEIGKYITVARERDGIWYVGSVAGNEKYERRLRLDFLTKGKKYIATIFSDDGKGSILKVEKEVTAETVLSAKIEGKGGEAMVIRAFGNRSR